MLPFDCNVFRAYAEPYWRSTPGPLALVNEDRERTACQAMPKTPKDLVMTPLTMSLRRRFEISDRIGVGKMESPHRCVCRAM